MNRWPMMVGALALARAATAEPARAEQTAAGPDRERARAIEEHLRSDPQLEDDKVTAAVSGKRVRLTGNVDTPGEKSRAELLVNRMDPTLIVENLLEAERDLPRVAEADRQRLIALARGLPGVLLVVDQLVVGR